MSSERLNEYFASEALEYLDQLDQLLHGDGLPDPGQLQRLATAVRGSMDMAGADRIAQLAGRLEQAARSLGETRLSWSEQLYDVVQRTTADLRALVASARNWGSAEEDRVRAALSRWTGILPEESAARPVVSIEALYFDDAGPHILFEGASAPAGARVVPIQELLLRGESALREALTLRPAFEALARGDGGSERSARELVDELFDLLELSLTPEVQEV